MSENNIFRVVSVNSSEEKGTIKKPLPSIILDEKGVQGDAHAGTWHRQVSLLARESIDKMQAPLNRQIQNGEFAENITTEGFLLYTMRPLDRIISGNTVLEVTQIGKKCHGSNCSIFKESGDCVMPKEGIFCRVIKGGQLETGNEFEYIPRIIKVKIITVSDRASRGEYEDKSGPLLSHQVSAFFEANSRKTSIDMAIVPDDREMLSGLVKKSIAEQYDIVFTTGGTGIGMRDITPEAVLPLIEKEIPGIMEFIRLKYGQQFPGALLSRSIAGVSDKTLIYCLPGSPKAVKEYAEEILKTVEHSLLMLNGIDSH